MSDDNDDVFVESAVSQGHNDVIAESRDQVLPLRRIRRYFGTIKSVVTGSPQSGPANIQYPHSVFRSRCEILGKLIFRT